MENKVIMDQWFKSIKCILRVKGRAMLHFLDRSTDEFA